MMMTTTPGPRIGLRAGSSSSRCHPKTADDNDMHQIDADDENNMHFGADDENNMHFGADADNNIMLAR